MKSRILFFYLSFIFLNGYTQNEVTIGFPSHSDYGGAGGFSISGTHLISISDRIKLRINGRFNVLKFEDKQVRKYFEKYVIPQNYPRSFVKWDENWSGLFFADIVGYLFNSESFDIGLFAGPGLILYPASGVTGYTIIGNYPSEYQTMTVTQNKSIFFGFQYGIDLVKSITDNISFVLTIDNSVFKNNLNVYIKDNSLMIPIEKTIKDNNIYTISNVGLGLRFKIKTVHNNGS